MPCARFPVIAGGERPDVTAQMREDACMVDSKEFETDRAEICASGPANGATDLFGLEIDSRAYLRDAAYADDDPGLWDLGGPSALHLQVRSGRCLGSGLGEPAGGDANRPCGSWATADVRVDLT